jgi:transcriptional regulator with XRE-family HTH domain
MPLGNPNLYEQIAKNVRNARRLASLTQEQLAEMSGVSRGTIASIESSRQNVPVHILIQIAAAFKIPTIELVPILAEIPDVSSRTKDQKIVQALQSNFSNKTFSKLKKYLNSQ